MSGISYKELGLKNTKDMFELAMKDGFAVPAYNFNNMEQLQAIITACVETDSPVILQVSKGARNYISPVMLPHMAKAAVELSKKLGGDIPIALHLDHGDSFDLCVECINSGFSSVMIDGSHLPYDENVTLSKKVADYAHKYGVTVEAELGVLSGVEDEVSSEHSHYTNPEDVEDFVKKTGVDSLAISIGTSHGAYKFKAGEPIPPLRFDILEEIENKIPGFPIVLHGASSVPQKYIQMINKYGGKLVDAVGIPDEELRKATKSAVCKINVDSDGRLAFTAKVREIFATKPEEFDPRKYLGLGKEELVLMYKEKNTKVMGSMARGAKINGLKGK